MQQKTLTRRSEGHQIHIRPSAKLQADSTALENLAKVLRWVRTPHDNPKDAK